MSTQLTYQQLRAFVDSYINNGDIAIPGTYGQTRDNTAGLLDKIAKTIQIDGVYGDPLAILNGDKLELAKDIEEYFANLVMPTAYDATGAAALAPADLTYMKPSYSKSLGRRKIKVTRRYDDMERAFTDASEYAGAIAMISKRLQDSKTLFDFEAKKTLLSSYAGAAQDANDPGNATAYSGAGSLSVGNHYRNGDTGPAYVCVKALASTSRVTFDEAVSGGYLVALDLVSTIAEPTDTATGEAFIKEVKKYVKKSKFISEGNSLNGNTLGVAGEGVVLIIKAGVMPSLEVDTLAGAFNPEQLGFGVEVIETDDFGTDDIGVIAMLIDRRGVKLHPSYIAVREQMNADGDFINYVMHFEDTAFYSRNTFLHVFKAA